MIVKVCGMKYPDNIVELSQLPINWMGMIFYEKSPRFVEQSPIATSNLKRVGVFVNADLDYIVNKIETYNLDYIQLHGNESPDFCKEIRKIKPVIKAFSISQIDDFANVANYEGSCDYFLFDTKTPQYGGSGMKFDWAILNQYKGDTPFLLSGGIGSEDAKAIKALDHPQMAGIDLNSRFEMEAGLKDINLLANFIKEIRYEQN